MSSFFSPRRRFALIGVATLLLSAATGLLVYAQGGAPGRKQENPKPGSSPVSPKDRDKTDPLPPKSGGGAPSDNPGSTRDSRRDEPTRIILTEPIILQPAPAPLPAPRHPIYVTPRMETTPPARERVPASPGGVSVMMVERVDERTLRYMIVDPETKTMSLMKVHLGRTRPAPGTNPGTTGADRSLIEREVVEHYVDEADREKTGGDGENVAPK
ncbi:MAG: hypothetical protein SFU56_14330 [Capsulimonadales bacterium]|nr:hypothetical protein [Capsulimonadales bacterium]